MSRRAVYGVALHGMSASYLPYALHGMYCRGMTCRPLAQTAPRHAIEQVVSNG
jgi:hypothetical protein